MKDQNRTDLLHSIARKYVVEGLGGKNFDSIPYHKDVGLRAPLNPGGSHAEISGRETLRTTWWAPLPQLVAGTTYLDSYVNKDGTGVTVEFYCDIAQPACRLRIVDRFTVDADGKITSQENFFDPRDVTQPDWNKD